MNPRRLLPPACRAPGQRGFVLVTGLLFLVVLTLLGLAMFRSTGMMDRIAGNTRDKQRTFEAAQSALQFGEYWLANGGGGVGSQCTGLVVATPTSIHVCSNPLASGYQNTLPFANGFTSAPSTLTVQTGGGLAASGDVNYALLPGFYIERLGLAPDNITTIYQVTAYAEGGNVDTVSVVRSVYALTPNTYCLSCSS